MRYLDVCAGISASTVAWKPLGWEAAAYSEIEPAPRAILEHRQGALPVDWDHRHTLGSNVTPLFGDFTQIEAHHVGPIDLLVGGTPCQDFSVAGLRAGLDGDRGNLSLEFCRLADRTRPRWVVWENVPGVLSISGGRAFGSILGGLGELGYGFAYRILDAQHFGVPQRRRRVFVVGYLGDHRRAGAVLFERHSLSGHPAPRRGEGQGVAGAITRGAFSGGAGGRPEGAAANHFVADVAGTLPAGGNRTGGDRQPGMGQETADTMLVAYAIQAGALRENPEAGPNGIGVQEGRAYTLEARAEVQAVCIHSDAIGRTGTAKNPSPDAEGRMRLRDAGMGISEDVSFNLTASNPHAVAFDMRGRDGGAQFEGPHDTANIRAASGGSSRSYVAASAVRRLTPRECERLQGFPDDYTLAPNRGKPMADGPRYKALGNSMAVPVMRWIGERIAAVDALPLERSEAA